MAWAVPQYNRSVVDRAGVSLVHPDEHFSKDLDEAYAVLNNWRSAHSYPLNTFQMTLRRKARNIDSKAVVSQRLKRLESITNKLHRQSGMKMSRMQDIGGTRAVVQTMNDLRKLEAIYKDSRFDHELAGFKDYIEEPKSDGYRSLHLVYKYKGKKAASVYNNLRIEVQMRTQLQHAWATAVETVGTFTNQALKSNIGDPTWLRFFSLMGSAIAFKEETPLVPNTPGKP
jgi:ppGpp synthetase/RelA/SpoT-type nucleotidyltranferase